MRYGTCFLCGKQGMMEEHHVFPAALRDKSGEYGYLVPLCGDTCHRLGRKSAHGCQETADKLKAHFQTIYMIDHHASVEEFRSVWYKNYLDLTRIEDERKYPMNIFAISGRLTADPELRHTATGTPVTSFRVAVKRPGSKEESDFFTCNAWRHNAEFVCKYFGKGSWIEVSGYIKNDKYEKDGQTIYRDIVEAERIFFGDGKRKEEVSSENGEESQFTERPNDDGELPF